jgi:hypothetical protein
MIEAALFTIKFVSNFLFLDFCIIFYVGPGPNPVPEPVCVTTPVPLRQKVEIPAVSVPDPVHTTAHGRNHT